MMKKQYTSAFKAKVVQELLKEEKTIAQIVSEYEVHPTQLRNWKLTAVEGLPSLFEKQDSTSELKASHEQKLTELIEQQDKETDFTRKLLDQKALEVETLNAGAIRVQEVGIEAEMKQERMNTQKEVAHLQNKAQIETMKSEQEQKVLIDRMRNSAMRAIFDPEMPAEQRQSIIGMLTGLMGATKELPPPGRIDTITEEDDL